MCGHTKKDHHDAVKGAKATQGDEQDSLLNTRRDNKTSMCKDCNLKEYFKLLLKDDDYYDKTLTQLGGGSSHS